MFVSFVRVHERFVRTSKETKFSQTGSGSFAVVVFLLRVQLQHNTGVALWPLPGKGFVCFSCVADRQFLIGTKGRNFDHKWRLDPL